MASPTRQHHGQQQHEKYTFFWKSHSPFSQWHPSIFTVDGVRYTCAEQFMMHRKAILFDDKQTAKEVLQSSDPSEMKALGRKVKNFDQSLWNISCKELVKTGNLAKFSQNEDLKRKLFATEGTTMVEASPVDRIWGIGLAADNPKARDRRMWRGKNLLGYILTEVRDELMLQEVKKVSLKRDDKSKSKTPPTQRTDHKRSGGQIKVRPVRPGKGHTKLDSDSKQGSACNDSTSEPTEDKVMKSKDDNEMSNEEPDLKNTQADEFSSGTDLHTEREDEETAEHSKEQDRDGRGDERVQDGGEKEPSLDRRQDSDGIVHERVQDDVKEEPALEVVAEKRDVESVPEDNQRETDSTTIEKVKGEETVTAESSVAVGENTKNNETAEPEHENVVTDDNND